MATVTTNFNFPIPQSTDLVKDGATAIAALGTSVDTQFVDLKGGTTGQVLAKASNTDLDYSWVTQDDANAIQNAIVDAKGDLIAATANDTPARLAVGNNGETLVADSSTATGLRYQGSITGGKNFAINGGFDVWQRGTSFTSSGVGYSAYTADRWTCYAQGAGTITQDTSLSASGFRYGIKFTSSAASSGNDFYQLVETDQTVPLAGKQVAVSGYCIATSGALPIMNLEYSTTVNDGLFGTYVQCTKTTISETTANGTLLRYTYSFAVPTTAKTLRLRASTGSLNNTNYAIWAGIQLEVGNVPTAFSRAGGTIAGELAACQRYFERMQSGGADAPFGTGVAYTSTAPLIYVQHQTPKRVVPSYSFSGTWELIGGNTIITLTSPLASTNSVSVFGFQMTGTATGMTQGHAQLLRSGTDTPYIDVSAEL